MIKAKDEIKRLRRVARLTDEVFSAIIPCIREGVTQPQLEDEIRLEALRRGASGVSFPPAVIFTKTGSEPSPEAFTYPREQGLAPGTSIAFDIGFVMDGYCSDFGRSLYFGAAPGHIRGALHGRPDGTSVRPSLVICDDPQTDQSARSPLQTAERLAIINGAIAGLAGPGQRTAIIVPCTVIRAGDMADQLLDRQKNPSWHGERTKLVYSFPTNARLWGEYARIRDESFRSDGDGSEAAKFYLDHQADMFCQSRNLIFKSITTGHLD